jgi:branched-chain amino acid transport system permease protein
MVVGMVLPAAAQFLRSIDYLIFVVFGGMGSMTGSVLAAYVLTALQEVLRFLPRGLQDGRLIFYAFLLILMMLIRQQGLLGMKEFSFVRTWDAFMNLVKGKNRSKGEASNA